MKKNTEKKIKTDLDAILEGGMKDFINSVDDILSVPTVPKQSTDSGVFTFTGNGFRQKLDHYLEVRTEKKVIYVAPDVLKQLEALQHQMKYASEDLKFVPLGSLASAIIKTFLDVYTAAEE